MIRGSAGNGRVGAVARVVICGLGCLRPRRSGALAAGNEDGKTKGREN